MRKVSIHPFICINFFNFLNKKLMSYKSIFRFSFSKKRKKNCRIELLNEENFLFLSYASLIQLMFLLIKHHYPFKNTINRPTPFIRLSMTMVFSFVLLFFFLALVIATRLSCARTYYQYEIIFCLRLYDVFCVNA
jgi:hypothetical protein